MHENDGYNYAPSSTRHDCSPLSTVRWRDSIIQGPRHLPGNLPHPPYPYICHSWPPALSGRCLTTTACRREDLLGVGMEENHDGDVRATEEVVKEPPTSPRIGRPVSRAEQTYAARFLGISRPTSVSFQVAASLTVFTHLEDFFGGGLRYRYWPIPIILPRQNAAGVSTA